MIKLLQKEKFIWKLQNYKIFVFHFVVFIPASLFDLHRWSIYLFGKAFWGLSEAPDYDQLQLASQGSKKFSFLRPIIIGRTDAEAPVLWPPDMKNWLTGRDPDAGKDWRQKKEMIED